MQEQQNCSHKTWDIGIEVVSNGSSFSVKDTHKEKHAQMKTPVLTNSMNMDILVVWTSNQLFIRGS